VHKSRLAGFIIDCQSPDLTAAAEFWGAALGAQLKPASAAAKDALYRALDTGPDGLNIEVQQVEHASRVHLDIETDDVEAEVARLVKLGAKPVRAVDTWWVMEAPTGQWFCVVRAQRADFATHAKTWE
jgi:predicted enzyme related to lactoylglutathione lyase